MLFLYCECDITTENKQKIRDMVKERTGEDCFILTPPFTDIRSFPVRKDKTAPLSKRLPRFFRK